MKCLLLDKLPVLQYDLNKLQAFTTVKSCVAKALKHKDILLSILIFMCFYMYVALSNDCLFIYIMIATAIDL